MRASDGVWVMRITTVNDDVAFLEERFELSDKVVDCSSSFYEEDDPPGCLKLGTEVFDRVSANDVGACSCQSRSMSQIKMLTLGFVRQECIDFGNGSGYVRFRWRRYENRRTGCKHRL